MNTGRFVLMVVTSAAFPVSAWAQNNAPVVSNVSAAQRGDASKLVDIHYDLADADGDPCTVWVSVSDNGGSDFRVVARMFTGDIGNAVTPGTNKAVVWDAGTDMSGAVGSNFKVRVWADDGNGPSPMVLVPAGWYPYQNVSDPEQWVYVDTFSIDKYEVTNAFYVQFLNNADPTAQHWVAPQEIDRWGDPGNYTYTVKTGKNNYPVRYVNYNDAVAFATWRSNQTGQNYRLPDQYEWEKAAAWDPVENHYFLFGYHQDVSGGCPAMNCAGCTAGIETTPVGKYNGTNGTINAKGFYGCYDMSGNVWEWTTQSSGSNRFLRGGSWGTNEFNCRCDFLYNDMASNRYSSYGFRLVLVPTP